MKIRACLRSIATAVLFCAPVLAAAQSVSPQMFSDMQWRLIGPFRGGRAVAVTGVPGDNTTFYFGSVDGGVWKTTDAGTVWTEVFENQPVASIGAIEVAPSDPKTIYVGTGESDIRSDLSSGDGVYKSTDAGKTWTHVGLADSKQISKIVVDPSDANSVYVGVLGHAYGPSTERGVYKSTDGGKTWTHVLDKGPSIGISDLAMAAGKPNVLFAGTWNAHRPPWSTYAPLAGPGSGLYRTTDGGATWTQMTGHGLPGGDWGRVGVAVAPNGQRVYALIEAPGPKQSGLYRSDDGGDSWTLENSDPRLTSRAWYFNRITVDPERPDVIYMPNVAFYRSEDGGKTISIVRGAPGGDDYHELWVDPKNSNSMALGSDQGTSLSLDFGKTWSTWYNQPTAQLYHVITDNEFPYVVYGAQQDSGGVAVYSRTNHGQITPRDWFPASGSESGYFAPDPNNKNIVYVTDTYGAVERWDRSISLSQDITPRLGSAFDTPIYARKYRDPWTPVLVFSPADKKSLYLGTQYVMKTMDGGLHWTPISPDLTGAAVPKITPQPGKTPTPAEAIKEGYGVVYSIAPSPLDVDEIWAGSDTGFVHLTLDGGKTWKDVTPPGLGPWSKISLIEASHFDKGEAWAAVDRHRMDDYAPYLYRTRDFGKTWQAITDGIPQGSFLRAVREDTKQKNLLFAGTEYGIYVSFNDGDHWQPLQLNLPMASVRDMNVHDDDLVAATHGRSFWILDDMTPLRELAAKADAAKPLLFAPEKAYRIDNNAFPGTPLPPEEPTAKNPPNGAILDYYLPAQAERVTLEIHDPNGKLVRRFTSNEPPPPPLPPLPIAARWFPKPQRIEATPGEHRFVWDLMWGSSGDNTPDGGDDEDAGAPKGPHALPGTYQVTLTVDGASQAKPLTVVLDPNNPATAEELQAQFDAAQRVYAETVLSRKALAEATSVGVRLAELASNPDAQTAGVTPQIKAVEAKVNAIVAGEQREGHDRGGLQKANGELMAVLRAISGGDRTPSAQALDLGTRATREVEEAREKWAQVKSTDLPKLNDALKAHHLQEVEVSRIEETVEYLMTR